MSTAPDTALAPVPPGDEHLRFYENFSKTELFGRRLDGDFFRGMFCRRGMFFARQFHHFIYGICRVAGRRRSHFVLEGQEVGMRISMNLLAADVRRLKHLAAEFRWSLLTPAATGHFVWSAEL